MRAQCRKLRSSSGALPLLLVVLASGGCAGSSGSEERTFAYVETRAPDGHSTIRVHAADPGSGTLAATGVEYDSSVIGALRGSAFGRYAYATRYSSERRSTVIAQYAIDPETGALTLLGDAPTDTSLTMPAEILVSGEVLVLRSNAATTGAHGGIASYRIDPRTGALSRVRGTFSRDPTTLASRPGSDWLYASANQGSLYMLNAIQGMRSGELVPLEAPSRTYDRANHQPATGVVAHPAQDLLYTASPTGIEVLAFSETSAALTLVSQVPDDRGLRLAAQTAGVYLFSAGLAEIRSYQIDPGGSLRQVFSLPSPGRPNALALDPSETVLFMNLTLVNSLEARTELHAYWIGENGTLSPVGPPLPESSLSLLVRVARD